jgi:NAD(P)-dependent dehydrogenase (short-subunit alcohol dehydrogenase family)
VPNALAQEEQVAAAVAFLASDEAAFVQGAALHVDGGGLTVSNGMDAPTR